MGIDWTLIIVTVVSIFFGVIGYLLSRKDQQQEDELKKVNAQLTLLFNKNDANVQAHRDLREQIAGGHYTRNELDVKFDKLEGAFKDGFREVKDGFRDMGGKIDKLTEVFVTHLKDANSDQRKDHQ